MEMIKITNQRNRLTLTMPQYMFWISLGCFLDGKYRPDALEIDEALHNNDITLVREILSRYGADIDFYEIEENE